MATTGEPFGLFWDSESGDRTYSAASFEYWLKKFFTSGVFNGDLQVKASSGMTLEIEPGYANVDGKVKFWNGAFTLTLNAANSTYPRIDTIVITRDNVNRQIVCEVVTGSYSGDTPQPTAPVRNTEIYQLVLAQIYVGAGVTGITQANITDTRPDNDLCGWITGTVEELDFSQFTAQFEQYFREFKADAEGDYESWFNEVQSEQIEDKEAWDAWYAALQEELHNLPADSAEYLQIQIDELKESGLSGSIFKVTTINPSLEGKTVRIINADNTEEKTGTFDSNLECVIYGMKSVGEITITSTDGIETATSVISIPYFGNYTVPIAFWAATVNMQGDTNLYGATITIKDSDDLTVGTVVLSAVDGTGTFTAPKADTYTFNYTYQGTSYSQELVVSEETTYSISLSAGFNWQIWVDTASQLDSTDYESLDEVLEDEKALRELFLEHACVDYMASVAASNEDLETVINNDYCAKWINLSDYALDFLHANEVIADLMDEADKYGYGEWALMPQVPKMTSNTAPYGVVSAQDYLSDTYAPWKAFTGNYGSRDGDRWVSSASVASGSSATRWIQYKFVSATHIDELEFKPYASDTYRFTAISLKVSNDGTNFDTEIYSDSIVRTVGTVYRIPLSYNGEYTYYRLYVTCQNTSGSTSNVPQLNVFQLNKWAPKGNVPVMTGASAPYGTASTGNYGSQSQTFSSNYYKVWGSVFSASNNCYAQNANPYLMYKFTNPTCVRGLSYANNVDAQTRGASIITVKGSNDGTNFDTIATITNTVYDVLYKIGYFTFENDDYYLYYKIELTRDTAYAFISCAHLQLYGRELKVSIPIMTSDTAPYGNMFHSEYRSTQTADWAWNAFDNNASTAFVSYSSAVPLFEIGYKFPSKVMLKCLLYQPVKSSESQGSLLTHTDTFYKSMDGTNWEILATKEITNSTAKLLNVVSFEPTELLYIKYSHDGATMSNNYTQMAIFGAYGFDYSEKEFEEGTTKKWLYDHGVDLEEFENYPISWSGIPALTPTTTSEEREITTVVTGQGAGELNTKNSIDLTPFSLEFMKVNAKMTSADTYNSVKLSTHTTKGNNSSNVASRDFVKASTTPYEKHDADVLDISSVNQSCYLALLFTNNASQTGTASIVEWWLE